MAPLSFGAAAQQQLVARTHKAVRANVSPPNAQGLSTLIWSLLEMDLHPPPAWAYSFVAAARAALPDMSALDLGQLVRALQRYNAGAGGLAKVDDFLLDALDRLSSLELEGGAFSAAQVQLLMRMRDGGSSGDGPQPATQQRQRRRQAAGQGTAQPDGALPLGDAQAPSSSGHAHGENEAEVTPAAIEAESLQAPLLRAGGPVV